MADSINCRHCYFGEFYKIHLNFIRILLLFCKFRRNFLKLSEVTWTAHGICQIMIFYKKKCLKEKRGDQKWKYFSQLLQNWGLPDFLNLASR